MERRVFELENATARMHTLCLQGSSAMSSIAISDKDSFLDHCQSSKVFDVQESKGESDVSSKNLSESCMSSSSGKNLPFSTSKMPHSVPSLKLPTSSTSISDNDVYSTPATVIKQCDHDDYLLSNSNSRENQKVLKEMSGYVCVEQGMLIENCYYFISYEYKQKGIKYINQMNHL